MWTSSLLLCLILQNNGPSVQDLLARIEALERRVQELEGPKNPPPLPVTAAHDAAAHGGEAATLPQAAAQSAAAQPQYPSLELRGFSDIDFTASDEKGTHSGFS